VRQRLFLVLFLGIGLLQTILFRCVWYYGEPPSRCWSVSRMDLGGMVFTGAGGPSSFTVISPVRFILSLMVFALSHGSSTNSYPLRVSIDGLVYLG
jgi:hypothetical protein